MDLPQPRNWSITQCLRHERREALELLFSQYPPAERAAYVDALLSLGERQRGALDGLFQSRLGERIAGSVLAQVQAGATATLWPPRLRGEATPQQARQLLDAVLGFCRQRHVRVVQTMLASPDALEAERLREAGFSYLTDLLYLVCYPLHFPSAPPADELEFEPYRSDQYDRLARLIEQTYQQTLDCPGLEGVRPIDEVLVGYQATGSFDPSRWSFVRQAGRDIGCLLLNEHPEHRQWELVYMGLVPAARGRGLGDKIARHALWLARQAGASQVVLAVDANNAPAIEAYLRAGFQVCDRRSVFLCLLER